MAILGTLGCAIGHVIYLHHIEFRLNNNIINKWTAGYIIWDSRQ